MKLHFVLNEPGSGEVAIPMADPAADDVASGKVVRVAYRGQYRGAFFVEDIGEKRITSGDYTGQVKTVRGRGAMAVLDRAKVWYANQGESTREFSSQPAAEMFVTLVEEAQARGGLSSLELTFDDTYDTDNNAWSDTRTLDFRVGTSLLDVMRKIAGLGIDFSMDFDWSRNVYYLNAYRDGRGSDKSSSIVFREGKNCTEVGNSEKSQELGNVVLVEYGDGQYVSVSNATSISEYERREIFLSAGQAGSSSEATAYGNAELDERKDPETSITVVVTDSEDPMAFVDYEVGDWVGYATYDDESPTSYRIRGMTLSWGQNQRWADVTLQLSSVQMELDIRTAQATGKLGGNLSSVRSTPNDALKALSDHNNDPDAHPNRDEFIEMEDTPGGYTSEGGKFLAVNVGEDGVEFKTISESDISDLDHDADKIKGKSVDAPQAGDDGKALVYDETNDKFAVETVSATGTFEGLSDVPAYSGNAGKVPKVNASEDGVEYEDVATQSELNSHTGDTNNPHSVSKGDVGLGNVENIKHNLTATRDPTISDGSSDGYSVGSKWINVDTDEEFVCLDATSSAAAVWKSTTDQGTGGSDADAIHDNVANEIQPVSEKASPVSADRVLIEDSEDSWNKKSAQLGNLPGGGGGGSASASYLGRCADLGCSNLWELDETSGTTASDSRGGMDGTYVGTPSLNQTGIDPESTGCPDFDGSNDGVNLPSGFDCPDKAESVSMSVYIEPDDVSTEQVVFELGGINNGLGIFIYNGSLYARLWSSNFTDYEISASVSVDTVYHVVVVMDKRGDRIALFLDGSLESNTGVGSNEAINVGGNDGAIGIKNSDTVGPNSGSPSPFNGKISGFAFWSRALADWEVNFLFDGTTL